MSILTVAEATRAVNPKGLALTTDQGLTLAEMIAALPAVLESECGPVEYRAEVFTVGCYGKGRLNLPWRFESISSVVVDGTTLSASTYDAVTDADRGILRESRSFAPWALGPRSYAPWASGTTAVITAMVGYSVLPGNIKQAAMELIRFWWQLSQQGRGAQSDSTRTPWAPPGELPPLIANLLRSNSDVGGFA